MIGFRSKTNSLSKIRVARDGHHGTTFRGFVEFLRARREKPRGKKPREAEEDRRLERTREMFQLVSHGGEPTYDYQAYGSPALRIRSGDLKRKRCFIAPHDR